ncbi:tripartite tricarboxylate transporter substrate binding protein [soil metagenome]
MSRHLLRRQFSSAALGLAIVAAFAPLHALAQAADYPSAPIRLVVPLPPGGASDHVARMLGEHLQTAWKQPVVIDNKPGGNGIIGAQAVARAAPDGYTLLIGVPSISTFKAFLKNPPIDTAKDLVPVAQLVKNPYVLAVPTALPITTVRELVDYAKARPGKLNYAGLAGGQTLAVEYFNQVAGIDVMRVPYKGEAPAVMALAANEAQVTLASRFGLAPILEKGQARALAVTTPRRLAQLPDVPTLDESGFKGFDVSVWLGVLAPVGLPTGLRDRIAGEVSVFLRKPDVVAALAKSGHTPVIAGPAEFGRLIDSEIARWADVARKAEIEPQ